MSDEEKDAFLARWSRRKVAARRGEALPEPTAPAPPPAERPAPAPPGAAAGEPALELPSIETLKGLESDYKAFMQPEIDPATRTAALKKLFGDPHFNTMDRLDVYIDDYSIPDPIPAAMLKTLSAARTLGLFDEDEEKKQEQEGEVAPVVAAAPAATLAPPDAAAAASELPPAASPEPEPAAPREKRDA